MQTEYLQDIPSYYNCRLVGQKYVKPSSLSSSIISVCTNLRKFQYKILNNILYLNARLFEMHIVDSGLCSMCNSAEESVLFLLLECRISAALWPQVKSWCTRAINLSDLCPKIIYFGISSGTSDNLVLNNHIILLYKKFPYDYRNDAYRISLRSFQHYLLRIQEIERKIASDKNKLTSHLKKWDNLLDILPSYG